MWPIINVLDTGYGHLGFYPGIGLLILHMLFYPGYFVNIKSSCYMSVAFHRIHELLGAFSVKQQC